VVVSLLASLLVAIFLVPMLASRRGVALAGVAGGPRLLAWATGRACRADARRLGRWLGRRRPGRGVAATLLAPLWLVAGLAALAYLLLRLVAGTALEIAGKLLLVVGMLLVLAWRKALGPAVRWIFGGLAYLPVRVADRLLDGLKTGYPRAIRWALAHSGAMVALVAAVLGVTWAAARGLESELLPEVHQGEFTFEVALPVGTPLAETDAVLAPVERAILAEKEHIETLILTVGFDAANSRRSDEGEHSAQFKILLDRPDPSFGEQVAAFFQGRLWRDSDVAGREEAVIRRLRRRLAEIPDLEARVARPVLFSSRTPIEVEVRGDDLPRLKAMGERVRQVMAALPELADVEGTLKSGAPEVEIVYDRDLLSRYGLNLRATAELVRNQVKGFEASRFNLRDRRVPIVVRLDEPDRETVEDVRALIVNPGGERPIPLTAVAAVSLGEGPSEVRRVDGGRVALVNANIAAGSLGGAVEAIRTALRDRIDWPDDLTFTIAGQNEEWQRSRGSLYLALALSIFLVYVIMAAQFESLTQPLVIMFTIPLAFFGTVVALWALSISLSVVVFLGMIMLAGIVVNNAIVLVDYINTLRGRGVPRDEAIVTAGSVRLRPILMTTATTVLGLLPMALGLGDGAEIRTPMAIAVISGLVTSTVLTLVVIPAVYALVDRARARLSGRAEEVAAGDAAGPPAGERAAAAGDGALVPGPGAAAP
jgi:HAE1 family hydrophobic/amphiphilic exporter-1